MSQEPEPLPKIDAKHPWPFSALEREWPRLKAAPLSFATILVMGIVIGVIATHSLYSTFIIPGKDATIERLKESSPDEQKRLIIELREQLKRYETSYGDRLAHEWEPLTDQQVATWAASLSKYPTLKIVVFWGVDVDAGRFYRSLQAVGTKAKIEVSAGSGNAGSPGLILIGNSKNPAVNTLADLCRGLSIPFRLDVGAGYHQEQELALFVGEKR